MDKESCCDRKLVKSTVNTGTVIKNSMLQAMSGSADMNCNRLYAFIPLALTLLH
jgi:hypothetical protein